MRNLAFQLAAASLASLMLLGACAPDRTANTSQPEGSLVVVPKVAAATSGNRDSSNSGEQYVNIQPRVPASSLGGKGSRLEIFFEGRGTPLRNGGTVYLDDLSIEVFVDPYPPAIGTSWLDLYLTRDGQPVTGARISIELQMIYMDHSDYSMDAKDSSDGHYIFSPNYSMYGVWGNTVTLRISGQKYEFPIMVTVYP